MVRLIHLTDFHLNQKTLKDWKNYAREALLSRLNSLDRKIPIDFIAFTGDLIDIGGSDFTNTELAFNTFRVEVIEPIINEVGLSTDKFLIIPGNHDIVRSLDSEREELGNEQYFKKDYLNISKFMTEANKNADYSGMKRVQPYKKFEEELYKDVKDKELTMFGSSFKYIIRDNQIGFCCLNSSWRSYDQKDLGRIIIGEDQLIENLNFIRECTIKIALVHHPLDWLIESERKFITNHLVKDFDALLLGHVHENKTSLQTGLSGSLFVNVAPSGLNEIRSDSRTHSNGFTVIDLELENKEIRGSFFRYNHDQKKFILNTDLAESGEFKFIIPPQKSKKKISIENTIIENIKEDHFLKMDEHLIGTKASKSKLSIKEGFILPPINQGVSSEVDPDEKTDLTLAEMMKSNFNLMFFGDQESGKTTLLYRLLREFVDEYYYIRKIPAYIDFEELGNKDINTAIKEYLRCSSEDVKNLLQEKHLLLIIDNLNFKKNVSVDQRNKLLKFNKDHQETQIIASAENLTSGILPTDYIDLNRIPFKNYFIKNLRAKEIKCIMKQWLPEESELDSDLRLEKLVNSFNSYALPSSAMSVSLFLWSMDYPERKPINHAVLLEIYIEILLQKLGTYNIYRENFDFTNKIQLLAKVAEEMSKSIEPNYSIKFSEFQSIVEKYLQDEVSFDFDADVIVNYFLERKLFVKYQPNKIKFTYSCFFHFFLAKRMIFNLAFKSYVISEPEYYKFYKEIDYYTALTRSDEDLLREILKRFEEQFRSTDFVYDEVDFDKYFSGPEKENEGIIASVAKNMEISKIKENRPSKEKMEAFFDRKLERTPNPGIIRKKDATVSLERLLIIMANVLRNSEGVENKALKTRAYEMQIKYSLTWTVLYREYIIQDIKKNKNMPKRVPKEMGLHSFLKYLPLSIQHGMNKHLASPKLAPIILAKMKKDLVSSSTSELETFLSVSLYADIEGKEFPKYLKSFVKQVKITIIRDYLFFNLIGYYYRRTRPNSTNEAMYLDLLSELKIKTQKLPRRMKLRVQKMLEDAKRSFEIGS